MKVRGIIYAVALFCFSFLQFASIIRAAFTNPGEVPKVIHIQIRIGISKHRIA